MNYDLENGYEAWISGFFVGVDACLTQSDQAKKTPEQFAKEVAGGEHNDLLLMMNFGRHEPHGVWSILGARMAVYMTLLSDWEPIQVTDEDAMKEIWQSIESQSPEIVAAMVAEELTTQLLIPIVMIDSDASLFISSYLQ